MDENDRAINRQIAETAQAIISGVTDPISGCRQLRHLAFQLGSGQRRLFDPIIEFESQTDDIPVGQARKLYADGYLKKIDREVKSYVEKAMPTVLAACETIVAHFCDRV